MKPTPWQPVDLDPDLAQLLTEDIEIFTRGVRDGELRAVRSQGHGWQLALTHYKRGWHRLRVPTWSEIVEARLELLPSNAAMYAAIDGVTLDGTVHLHEHRSDQDDAPATLDPQAGERL